jgi:hypothetical protein
VDRVCGRVGRWSCGVKVLQLSSDWKWTGPAAPMLQLLLAQREQGHEVELASWRGRRGPRAYHRC